jgi:uncharacterized protein YukE
MPHDDDYLNIRFETLEQAEVDLAVAYRAVTSTIEELKAKLAHKLEEWSDDANDEYRKVQAQWQAATDHMAVVLNQAHIHVGNTREMYVEMERQSVSIWQ